MLWIIDAGWAGKPNSMWTGSSFEEEMTGQWTPRSESDSDPTSMTTFFRWMIGCMIGRGRRITMDDRLDG